MFGGGVGLHPPASTSLSAVPPPNPLPLLPRVLASWKSKQLCSPPAPSPPSPCPSAASASRRWRRRSPRASSRRSPWSPAPAASPAGTAPPPTTPWPRCARGRSSACWWSRRPRSTRTGAGVATAAGRRRGFFCSSGLRERRCHRPRSLRRRRRRNRRRRSRARVRLLASRRRCRCPGSRGGLGRRTSHMSLPRRRCRRRRRKSPSRRCWCHHIRLPRCSRSPTSPRSRPRSRKLCRGGWQLNRADHVHPGRGGGIRSR